MNHGNEQRGAHPSPIKLLFVGATEAQQHELLPLLSAEGNLPSHRNVTEEASLQKALATTWDLILICRPVIEIRRIGQLLESTGYAAGMVLLSDDPRGNTALQAMHDGVRDIISLAAPEHLKLAINRELTDLCTRRALREQTPAVSSDNGPASISGDNKDLLTGLHNQRHFIRGVHYLFKKIPPDNGVSHSVLYITLDNIEAVHQRIGIAAADIIVAEAAQLVRSKIPSGYPVARFSDYSFAVLLHKIDTEKADSIANTLCSLIASHRYDVVGNDVSTISCSIGYASTDDTIDSAVLLIKKSQLACEGAIAAGGNQSHLYAPEDEQYGIAKTQKLEHTIRDALKEDRFKLHYQPIVNLHSTCAENYEILLRMVDPEEKELLPADFMPTAAAAGLMPAIDRWVTRNALNELTRRRRAGKDTSFFIKLDHATLSDTGFHAWLSERLRGCGLPGDALVFQISENSAVNGPKETVQFIKQLKILRCRCGLEHFGDSPDSLERMQELPLDFIKINRTLVQAASENDLNKNKIKLLVTTAHEQQQQTIAEFVQDANTLSILWSCGVDYIQGYFLQRPDPEMDYDFSEES